MHIVGDHEHHGDTRTAPSSPVVIEWWAEAVVDLERERSRRRHPSNAEPASQTDGGDARSEWVI